MSMKTVSSGRHLHIDSYIKHLPVRSFPSLRTYSTNVTISPDSHSSNTFNQRPRLRRMSYRPLAQGRLQSDLSFSEKNEHRKAAMARKAHRLSQDWPESLIDPISSSTSHDSSSSSSSSSDAIPNMTTNFLIYIPYRIMNQPLLLQGLDRSQVFRNVRLLLLKRSPEANPYPNTWAAVSGRVETDISTDKLETPLSAALREIKEETNQDPILFGLETALQPQIIKSPNSKQWRVWSLLWRKHFSRQQHDFELDSAGNLSDIEAMKKVDLLLNRLIRLNHENVEMSWKGREEIGTLQDLVPGLLETFDYVLETWIKQQNTRYEFLRKKAMTALC